MLREKGHINDLFPARVSSGGIKVQVYIVGNVNNNYPRQPLSGVSRRGYLMKTCDGEGGEDQLGSGEAAFKPPRGPCFVGSAELFTQRARRSNKPHKRDLSLGNGPPRYRGPGHPGGSRNAEVSGMKPVHRGKVNTCHLSPRTG